MQYNVLHVKNILQILNYSQKTPDSVQDLQMPETILAMNGNSGRGEGHTILSLSPFPLSPSFKKL